MNQQVSPSIAGNVGTRICNSSWLSYCGIAKILVSIGAIPILAVVLASVTSNASWQFAIAAYTGAIVVLVAQWIDRLTIFSGMVCRVTKKAT